MAVKLTGILENNPKLGVGGVCTATLAAGGEVYTVEVSSQHAQWVVSTFEGGQLVEIVGQVAAPGIVHAARVRLVELILPAAD